jgi:N-acetylmuramoyl-L-alanine amidase
VRRRTVRLLTAALLLLTLFGAENRPAAAQPAPLTVRFTQDPNRRGEVAAFQRQGILYASLTDLAPLLNLRIGAEDKLRRIELRGDPLLFRLTPDNSFLLVTDPSRRQRVYQLPAPVLRTVGGSHVPAAAFLQLLRGFLALPVRLDAARRELVVGEPATPSGPDITTLTMETRANGMVIRIPAARPLTEFESWLRDDGWLYVTIAGARADAARLNAVKPQGLIREIVAIQSAGSLQLTFRLGGKVAAAEVVRDGDSNDLLVTLRVPGAEDQVLLEGKKREIQADLAQQRKRWELDVIVLDPGHGGMDHGATGVTGLREKDVTLGVALKLGRLIRKHLPDVKVVYTRTDDRFVPLYRRGQIANEANGKLFISIHANSLRRKPNPTRGFEVYLLRPGRTDEAIAIAEQENSVIELEEGYEARYQQLTDENFILLTMAQSQYARASELFADIALQEMEDQLSIPNRGVRQAGFLVLVGASMPNVLVETAYLSNREDERFLRGQAGQQKLAQALLNAVKRYKTAYERLLLEGKDLGVLEAQP